MTTFGGQTVPPLFVGGGGGSGGDPVGTLLTWNADLAGAERLWNTTDGIIFGFNSSQAELVSGQIGQMIAFNRNQPPSVPKENNYTSPDGLIWTQQNAAIGNLWAQQAGAQVNTLFWLQVAQLWFVDIATGTNYYTSADGIAWTQGTFPGAPSTISEDGYMTDGVDDFIIADDILWATQDGINWNSRGTQSGCAHLIFDPNLNPSYWCFGSSFGNANVRSSTTGVNGSFSDNVPAETSLNATAINWNAPLSVARKRSIPITVFGSQQTGAGTSPAIHATSPDNVVWTENPAAARGFGMRYSGTLDAFVSQQANFVNGVQSVSINGKVWVLTEFFVIDGNSEFFSADLLTSF